MDKDKGLGGKNGNSKEACLRKQEGNWGTQTNYHAVKEVPSSLLAEKGHLHLCMPNSNNRQSNSHSAEDDIGFSAGKRADADVAACHSNEGSNLAQSNFHAVKELPFILLAEKGHLCMPNSNNRQNNSHSAEEDIGFSGADADAGACHSNEGNRQNNSHSAEEDIGFSAGKRADADAAACHSNEGSSLTQSNCHTVKELPSSLLAEKCHLNLCMPNSNNRQSNSHSAEEDIGFSAGKRADADVAACHSNLQSNGHLACNNSTLHTFNWRGVQFQLPSALHLAPGCTLSDELLEFRGSCQVLERAVALLEEEELGLQFDLVDGALWISMASSLFTDMLPGLVEHQLALWRERCQIDQQYEVSGSSSMIYSSNDSKMMIADCYIFTQEAFMRGKEIARRQHRVVPQDIEAEVAFEFVSATDDVEEIWSKCKRFVVLRRAKLAIGICDRENQKEVLVAFNDRHGNVQTEVRQDPRYIDLGRVLPEFRIYFSYMMPVVISHFTAHHQLDLHTMHKKDLRFQLCEAISRGSNELAMEIVNGLDTVNFNDEGGRSPLVVAISTGNIEMAQHLVECKTNPRFLDGDNVCALLHAKAHNMQIYDGLRSACGGDIFVSMRDLLVALDKNSPKSFEMILKVFLASGADIDEIIEDDGCTILSHAVSSGRHLWAVKILIQAGACSTKADAKGVTPLKKAIFSLSEDELLESDILSTSNIDMQTVRFWKSLLV